MTTTKHRISSKIFVASIVAVIILSLLISPIMAITVTAATSSDASYSDEFKGYGEEKTNEEIHLLTRLTSPSEDAPSMTVLVHGQGGNASHWSMMILGQMILIGQRKKGWNLSTTLHH